MLGLGTVNVEFAEMLFMVTLDIGGAEIPKLRRGSNAAGAVVDGGTGVAGVALMKPNDDPDCATGVSLAGEAVDPFVVSVVVLPFTVILPNISLKLLVAGTLTSVPNPPSKSSCADDKGMSAGTVEVTTGADTLRT